MKSFIFKINENGRADFMDEKDKAVYKRLLSSIKKSGKDKFRIVIELLEEGNKITEKQQNLFNVIVNRIASHTGNDYNTVKETLVENNLQGKDLTDLTSAEYSDFLERIIVFSNEFFGLSIQLNPETNHIEISKY